MGSWVALAAWTQPLSSQDSPCCVFELAAMPGQPGSSLSSELPSPEDIALILAWRWASPLSPLSLHPFTRQVEATEFKVVPEKMPAPGSSSAAVTPPPSPAGETQAPSPRCPGPSLISRNASGATSSL